MDARHVPRLRESRSFVVSHHVVLALPWTVVLVLVIVAVMDLALGRVEYEDPFGGTRLASRVPHALTFAAFLTFLGTAATVPAALVFVVAGAVARVPRHWHWAALWIAAWILILTLPPAALGD